MRRFGLIVGVVAILSSLVTCNPVRAFPGVELTSLPAHAIGAVSIGAVQTPKASAGQALTFLFDDTGKLLGRLEGRGIEGNGIIANGRELIAPSNGTATKLTPTGKFTTELPGYAVSAGTFDSETGTATMWFEQRGERGFVSIAPDNTVRTGKVGGRLSPLRTAADCGRRQFVIFDTWVNVDGPKPNTLYEVLPDGSIAVRGTFELTDDVFPYTRVSACGPDRRSILTVYGNSHHGANPNWLLVRTDLADGSRTQTQLDHAGNIWKGSLTVVGDRLYWLGYDDNNVYSVALDGIGPSRPRGPCPERPRRQRRPSTGPPSRSSTNRAHRRTPSTTW